MIARSMREPPRDGFRSRRARPTVLVCCCGTIPPRRQVRQPHVGKSQPRRARRISSAASVAPRLLSRSPRTAAVLAAVGLSPGIIMNASSTRRYLSVWLRRLATDRLARVLPRPADEPLVIVAPIKSALRITALNDAAARLRLRAGMALADARAMYPALAVEHADPEADQRLLEAI